MQGRIMSERTESGSLHKPKADLDMEPELFGSPKPSETTNGRQERRDRPKQVLENPQSERLKQNDRTQDRSEPEQLDKTTERYAWHIDTKKAGSRSIKGFKMNYREAGIFVRRSY